MTYELSKATWTSDGDHLDQELELIARKKCKKCRQYMSKDILSPICLKCYEIKKMLQSNL
jgi:hypothetical protein